MDVLKLIALFTISVALISLLLAWIDARFERHSGTAKSKSFQKHFINYFFKIAAIAVLFKIIDSL